MALILLQFCVGMALLLAHSQAQTLWAAKEEGFRTDVRPYDPYFDWWNKADKIGKKGWTQFDFLMVGPSGDLYAVKGGNLYADKPPVKETENWIGHAKLVGVGGWDQFKFLFFGPDVDLFAVTKSGKFYRGPAPIGKKGIDAYSWIKAAKQIGTNNWNNFRFLFFNPDTGDLYGVYHGEKFYKRHPPTHPQDCWICSAQKIGSGSWDQFNFLFFDRSGYLYAVDDAGKFFRDHPPRDKSVKWVANAKKIGAAKWNDFKFLFFQS